MPDPNSIRVMSAIDRMPKGFRALVHEFGAVIVDKMMADGYSDPAALRTILEGWRERRQDQWLKTDYAISRKVFERDY
jgi:hypothetical protein